MSDIERTISMIADKIKYIKHSQPQQQQNPIKKQSHEFKNIHIRN